MGISPAVREDVYRLVEGRAEVSENYLVVIPEISSPMPGFPSIIAGMSELSQPGWYTFVEGGLETALPLLREGCGLLLPPGVAARQRVGVGDRLMLRGLDGPIDCTVAGVGHGGTIPFSIVGPAARDAFYSGPPIALAIWPLPGADVARLEADLSTLTELHGDDAWLTPAEVEIQAVLDTSDQMENVLYGMLILAVVAAALGMINTTVMSVAQRRRELGLLRAVGATQRQVRNAVAGEAALMGLVGGGLGLVGGVGLTAIFCLTFGGIPFGLTDLDLWDAARQSVGPALRTGLLGIALTPLVSALAAWLLVRAILQRPPVDVMRVRET